MMDDEDLRGLSCAAKIARVVLDHCGPLCPSEVAQEAYVSPESARKGLVELAERELAEPVCGVCQDREVVYALLEVDRAAEPGH